jgi:hypothetical protein
MISPEQEQLSIILGHIADQIDIPPSKFEDAENKYNAVSRYLGEDETLSHYSPWIYSQGSFRLGTCIKPIGQDEFDIDLVCQLNVARTVNQRRVFELIGDRLSSNETYSKMLEQKNRCWRLNYAGDFHMDILPGIPDVSKHNSSILIPDKELSRWKESNPIGYSEWFYNQMKTRRDEIMKAMEAQVDDIPEWRIKTPLQKAVQILKYHRDIVFKDDPKDKPISIIITTLAAHAYNNEADLFEALANIISNMYQQFDIENGQLAVFNPTNDGEKFTDKWEVYPERRIKCLNWLQSLRSGLFSILDVRGLDKISKSLESIFENNVIQKSIEKYASDIQSQSRYSINRSNSTKLPSRFNVSHRQTPPWPIERRYSVTIIGKYKRMGLWYTFPSDSQPLSKYMGLLFIAETNVPHPYSIYWQVVNTGNDAKNANCLRGNIFLSNSNRLTRSESTQYRGMHWIECFIVKDGICVARSGEYIVNIE